MKAFTLVLFLATCVFTSIVSTATATTNSPPSGFDLTKLRKFYDAKGENPETSIAELIFYLREEVAHPSQPRMGVGGGPIDTVYVQDVMITVMAQAVPQQTLLRAYSQEKDNTIKTRLMLALATAGDRTFLTDVQDLLETSDDNLIRLAATRALRNAPKERLEAVLPTVRDDTYSRIVFRDGRYVKVYPIRQSAHEALAQANVTPKGWTFEVPLTAETEAAALATVLDDENIGQSVAVLQAVRNSSPAEAVRIAQTFVEANARKPRMAPAIRQAQEILNTLKDRGTNTVQNPRSD